MSFELCKAALRSTIEAIAPTRAARYGFVCIQTEDAGRQSRLEDLKSGTRYFEIVASSTPLEAGEGIRPCRWTVDLLIRVRYDYTYDHDPADSMIVEDAISIIKAIRKPSNWDQSNTGMRSLIAESPADPIILGDDDDRPSALIFPFPVTITFKDC